MIGAGAPGMAQSTSFRAEMRRAVEEAERDLPPAAGHSMSPPAVPSLSAPATPAPAPMALPATPPGKLLPNPALQPAMVTPPPPSTESGGGLSDPLEGLNRAIQAFNGAVMRHLLDPLVDFYRHHVPVTGQRYVTNVFRNLREPVNLMGAALQWEWGDAQIVLSRFVINSTLGIGGLLDQASVLGFGSRVRTIDQAFCRWGMAPGPYVMLPLLGPSSLRDTAARAGVLTVQALVVGLWVIPYRVLDLLAQYAVTRDTWEALGTDQPEGYERLRAIYDLYTQLPCTARNAADNGLFFQ